MSSAAVIRIALVFALALPWRAQAAALPLQPAEGGSYGESYTVIADLEGGGYVQVAFGLTNLGPGGLKGLCRALAVEPGQATLVAGARVGAGAWRIGEQGIEVGPCRARVEDGKTVVEAKLPELAVRLEFAAAGAPGAGPGATAEVGGEKYRTEVLLYRVPVTARVERTGGSPVVWRGVGYGDHTRSTVPPRALARRWIRFRSLRDERPLLVLVREGLDGALGPAQACGAGGACAELTRLAVERAPGEPRFTIRMEGREPAATLTLRSGPLLFRDAPVEALGLLRYLAGLFFGSPVTYVFRGTATDGTGAAVEGILEVELRDE